MGFNHGLGIPIPALNSVVKLPDYHCDQPIYLTPHKRLIKILGNKLLIKQYGANQRFKIRVQEFFAWN